MTENMNNLFAVLEVLIFVGGILIGYTWGKGWMKSNKKVEVQSG